jgi:hypothetical protein
MTPAAPPFLPDLFRMPPRPAKRPAGAWRLAVPAGSNPKYRIN